MTPQPERDIDPDQEIQGNLDADNGIALIEKFVEKFVEKFGVRASFYTDPKYLLGI